MQQIYFQETKFLQTFIHICKFNVSKINITIHLTQCTSKRRKKKKEIAHVLAYLSYCKHKRKFRKIQLLLAGRKH